MSYAIVYTSHLLTTMQNFTEIVSEEPLRRWLNERGIAKYSDVGHVEGYISETMQDTASGTINDCSENDATPKHAANINESARL